MKINLNKVYLTFEEVIHFFLQSWKLGFNYVYSLSITTLKPNSQKITFLFLKAKMILRI